MPHFHQAISTATSTTISISTEFLLKSVLFSNFHQQIPIQISTQIQISTFFRFFSISTCTDFSAAVQKSVLKIALRVEDCRKTHVPACRKTHVLKHLLNLCWNRLVEIADDNDFNINSDFNKSLKICKKSVKSWNLNCYWNRLVEIRLYGFVLHEKLQRCSTCVHCCSVTIR